MTNMNLCIRKFKICYLNTLLFIYNTMFIWYMNYSQ